MRSSPRPHWRGFSFALRPTRCRAFILPCYNTAPHKRLQRVLPCQCDYTANIAKQRTELYKRFSCNLPHSTAADTRPTQTATILPAPRWSVSQRRSASSAYHIPQPRRTLCRSAQPPIIIRYIMVQGCAPVIDPYQTVQHIANHASPAGSAPTVCRALASADTLPAVQTRQTR